MLLDSVGGNNNIHNMGRGTDADNDVIHMMLA